MPCSNLVREFPFFFVDWGLNSGPTLPALFDDGFFEMGSHELFAQVGIKP
jgi:hypothetical protein